MDITVENVSVPIPVAVVSTHGDVDSSNYLALIAKAKEVIGMGATNLLIDLGDSSYLSSSGLVALHSIAVLMRGEKQPDLENGWDAIRNLRDDAASGFQPHVKLLNPRPNVRRVLATSGLQEFFQIFTDRETALASYQTGL